MLLLTIIIIFLRWKIVIKTFSSIFYVLNCSFYNPFLIRSMKMMFNIQESTCLWIPCSPSIEILCFPYFLMRLYKLFSHKHVSFDGDANTRNRLISWLHSNLQPSILITYCNQRFIYNRFRQFASRLEYLLWFVALNPIPNGNVVPCDKLRQPLRCFSK